MALQLRVRSTRSCARETSESNHRRNFLSRKESNMLMSREQMARRCTVLRSLAVEPGRGFSIPQSCSQCPGSERPAQTSQRPEEYKAMCRCHARLREYSRVAAFLFQMEGERRKALWWGLKLKPDNLGALEGSKNGLIAHQQGRQGTALTVPGNARAL